MKTFFQSLLLTISLTPAFASATMQTLFNELEREGVLKVELELNLDTLEHNARTSEEQPAIFRFTDRQGAVQEWSADVNVRGRFRRRVCAFPPIKIDFSKNDLRARGLLPFDDIKLVTHCQEGEEGQEAVLREFLAYELYGKLSPMNFRAQLVEVTYIDAESNIRFTKYGILLEDADELAARLNSEECEACYGLEPSQVNPEAYRTHAMFQYMIGNTDWSLEMARNLKVMKPLDGGAYWIAPYDFDFSGLVGAGYALPNNDVGQKSVSQRVYMGTKSTRPQLEESIRHFQSKREEVMACVEGFTLLSRKSRREITRYLESFYDSLDEEEFLQAAALAPGDASPVAKSK
ncbi:MAG: hypothetical protein KDD10_01010 [Phaeodactylibacter sp.]|nr:hypothetical protein [Phaeodactylibacter sp.]MCB9296193.1 hypothetical protein [Lewinellaceae bacterium]